MEARGRPERPLLVGRLTAIGDAGASNRQRVDYVETAAPISSRSASARA